MIRRNGCRRGRLRHHRRTGDPRKFRAYGVAYWFRADLGVTTSSGVSQLVCQFGTGNDVSQGTGTAQPAQVLAAYNGRPCLRFVGASSQYLSKANTNIFGTGPYTIIFTVKNNTLPGAFTGGSGCTNTSAGVSLGTNGNTRTDLIFGLEAFGISAGNASTAVVETYEAWRPAASNHKGTFNNGAVLTSGSASLNTAGATGALMLGAHLNSGAVGGFMDADFLETIAYLSDLTASAITRIDSYQKALYARP